MDIKAEIGRHTDEAEQIITSYLPEEKGYQKTVIEAMTVSYTHLTLPTTPYV